MLSASNALARACKNWVPAFAGTTIQRFFRVSLGGLFHRQHDAVALLVARGQQRAARNAAPDLAAAAVDRVERGLAVLGLAVQAGADHGEQLADRQPDIEREQGPALHLLGAQAPEVL